MIDTNTFRQEFVLGTVIALINNMTSIITESGTLNRSDENILFTETNPGK
jgi:hypothetical protein